MQNTFSVSFTQPVVLEKAMVEKLILRIAEIDIALDTLNSIKDAFEISDSCERKIDYLEGQQLALHSALYILNVREYMNVGIAIEKAKLYLQSQSIISAMTMKLDDGSVG